MKKRIIASILACVMILLALCSCGANKFDFAENSSEYAKVNLEEFKKALAALEIEDADFTTDEATRADKVIYNILGTLTSNIIKATTDEEKSTSGTITGRDVLYFCYYITYSKDGKDYVFSGSQMKPSTITASSTAGNHVVELAVVKNNEDAKFGNALYDALVEKFGADENGKLNDIVLSDDTKDLFYDIYSGTDKAVKAGDKIVVSYTRQLVVGDDATEDEKAEAAKTEKVLYTVDKPLVLDKTAEGITADEAALIDIILGEGMTSNVGEVIYKTNTLEDGKTETQKVFENITVGDKTYKYSNIKIEWKIDKMAEPLVSFDYELTSSLIEENNAIHSSATHGDSNDKITVAKGEKVTYHIYPVNYISIPEISAVSILKEIFGKNIGTDKLDIFASEEYKNGDTTVKALVETLKKIWAEDTAVINPLKNADESKTLEQLAKDEKDAADKLKAANKTDENYADLEAASKAATKAFDDALEYNIDEQIKKIAEAKKGEESAADAIVKEYKEFVYDQLKTAYDDEIIKNVGKAVWALVDKYVTVDNYPAEMVEEFYEHIYEEHEYNFYNGKYNTTTGESNYSHYDANLEEYLADVTDATNGDYKTAITEDAKEYLKPILQVYALAKALEDSNIKNTVVEYINKDKEQGKYTVHSHEGHNHSEAEGEAEQESLDREFNYLKSAAENGDFLVDEDAVKAYKKYLGKTEYNSRVDYYGEVNILAGLQLGRVMDYLLSVNVSYDEEGEMSYNYKTVGEGEDAVVVIDFRTLSYTIKAETNSDSDSDNENK